MEPRPTTGQDRCTRTGTGYIPADAPHGSAHDQVRRPQGRRALLTARRASQSRRLHQEQLASKLGISRRRIAYYEAESDHPPVGFLANLARVLNTTTDTLLGHRAGNTKTRSLSLSPGLERRLKQIKRLSPKPKQQLLSIIDSFIAAEEHRTQGANRSQRSRS